jgi:hypothetical protein
MAHELPRHFEADALVGAGNKRNPRFAGAHRSYNPNLEKNAAGVNQSPSFAGSPSLVMDPVIFTTDLWIESCEKSAHTLFGILELLGKKMTARTYSAKKKKAAVAMFLQYYLWSFSLIVFHRHLHPLFSHAELKKWHGIAKNAHLFSSIMAFRVLNEFFRRCDHREDIRAHHFGYRSRGQFIPQREIDRISKIFMHASYGALRLRRPQWNMVDWHRRLAKRAVPFLEFLRDTYFKRSPQTKAEIEKYLSMTTELMSYAERTALEEGNV